jgi:hypothetical protein
MQVKMKVLLERAISENPNDWFVGTKEETIGRFGELILEEVYAQTQLMERQYYDIRKNAVEMCDKNIFGEGETSATRVRKNIERVFE